MNRLSVVDTLNLSFLYIVRVSVLLAVSQRPLLFSASFKIVPTKVVTMNINQVIEPQPPPPPSSSNQPPAKRPQAPKAASLPVKRSKWTLEEDALVIKLRGKGVRWEDISKELPGRSAISCRLHYQNYLERRIEWTDEMSNKLAMLYERYVLYLIAALVRNSRDTSADNTSIKIQARYVATYCKGNGTSMEGTRN
jgi:hypothetical protein